MCKALVWTGSDWEPHLLLQPEGCAVAFIVFENIENLVLTFVVIYNLHTAGKLLAFPVRSFNMIEISDYTTSQTLGHTL